MSRSNGTHVCLPCLSPSHTHIFPGQGVRAFAGAQGADICKDSLVVKKLNMSCLFSQTMVRL